MSGQVQPRQPQRITERGQVTGAERVIMKIGSSSLTGADHLISGEAIARIADCAADLRRRGVEVVLVSSGAIAAALGVLNLAERPSDIPMQQAAASVGQARLAAAWAEGFARHGIVTGQVLLTEADVLSRETYRNVRSALESLLALGVIPVVNENDTTATDEIRFGDNDRLAALLAQALGADLLVLLTDVDGLHTAPPGTPGSERLSRVEDPAALTGVSIGSVGSKVGTGGMVTKLSAASLAAATGSAVVLAQATSLAQVIAGEDVGTFFPARHSGRRNAKMVWLRFATRGAGRLVVDDGAATALRTGRRSLLPVGLTQIEGTFPAGVPVDVVTDEGDVFARGLVEYSSEELRMMRGKDSADIKKTLGVSRARPAIHHDHLVLL